MTNNFIDHLFLIKQPQDSFQKYHPIENGDCSRVINIGIIFNIYAKTKLIKTTQLMFSPKIGKTIDTSILNHNCI